MPVQGLTSRFWLLQYHPPREKKERRDPNQIAGSISEMEAEKKSSNVIFLSTCREASAHQFKQFTSSCAQALTRFPPLDSLLSMAFIDLSHSIRLSAHLSLFLACTHTQADPQAHKSASTCCQNRLVFMSLYIYSYISTVTTRYLANPASRVSHTC